MRLPTGRKKLKQRFTIVTIKNSLGISRFATAKKASITNTNNSGWDKGAVLGIVVWG
jgi:hypothetical protein